MIGRIIKDNPCYGYPRIKKALKDGYQEAVNHKLLLKLLKLWGLELKRKTRSKKKSWITRVLDFLQSRANLLRQLERKGGINRCFQIVVSDITQISFKGGKAYLCVHLDYFGKAVYGWSLSLDPGQNLVLDSFKKAKGKLKKLGIKNLVKIIFHQDRGVQYTSAGYTAAVLTTGAWLSFSKKGEPGDNAVNEAFFSRLKEEWRDVFSEVKTFEELESLIKKVIDYYNERRYHTSIGNQAPMRFTENQIKKLKKSV
jgi:putative transposase